MFDVNCTSVDAILTYGKPDTNYSNYIFYLEFIDDNTCRIAHTFGDIVFYLSATEDKHIKFLKNPKDGEEVFVYVIDGNVLRLFKNVLHKNYNEVGEVIKTYTGFYSLGVERGEEKGGELKLYDDIGDDSNVFAYVHDTSLDFNFYVDSSWVAYDRSQYVSSINRARSATALSTQSIIHHQYNKSDGFNFVPLKNNISYRGSVIRGANMVSSDFDYPDVDFRTYTNLHTGFNQEKGSDTITLSFVFNDQEYEVNDGDDLHFTIPEKSLEATNGLEPLWPYKYINLNDTKFIKNGAFGSNVPYFADKVKRYQGSKSLVKDLNGNRATPNNGVYLCSWLYRKSLESEPIWLDRYYYPDIIDRAKALKGISHYEQSFDNILDKNYTLEENDGEMVEQKHIRNQIYKNTYIDKVSDLIIEPANSYIYHRLSSDMVNEVLDNLSNNLIPIAKDQNSKDVYLWDEWGFNNENYRKIDYKAWADTNQINFNTDIYLRRGKRIGLQLFGSDYTSGFNIQNRRDVAPYHYYASQTVVYLLNNKYEIVHSFDLYEKYEDMINKVILGEMFDDVYVITGIWLYILSYDLRLKSRIDLTAKTTERLSIKGMDQIATIRNNQTIKLINYPYGNNEKTLDRKITKNSSFKSVSRVVASNQKSILRVKNKGYKRVSYDKNSGFILYPSNLSKMLCENKSIAYKNNIFIPIDSEVLKIIFCPSCQKDFDVFSDEDREEYPASCRLLVSDEYRLNYIDNGSTGKNEENISLESGFIAVENKIKTIYIDEDETVYCTNFDKMAISPDGDTIYGLYAQEKYLATGQWFWLFNQSMSKIKADVATSKYAEWASPNSIDMVRLNERGEMCLIRNFHNLADNENDDNNKRMDIYDKTKKRIYTFDLTPYEEVITLDAYNFIDEAHVEHSVFSSLVRSGGQIYVVQYYCDEKRIGTKRLDLPTNTAPNFYEVINSNVLLKYKDYNSLYFNLHVPSNYIYDYIATIKWSLDDIQDGWYNINVAIDLDEATFEVRVNDVVLDTISEKTHSWFLPHVSSNGTVFNSSYFIGRLGKKYGTTLNNIIKNAIYDPYICKDAKIAHTQIYNKKLEFFEYQAMRMREKRVNPIVLTLPCGSRNNIDEIVRYFKYNAASAISNKIKINVTGTGLQTKGEFELVKKEIMNVLADNKDCLVEVEDIEFV